MSRARDPWWIGPAGVVGAAALRLLGRTWRLDDRGFERHAPVEALGGRCIFALWHARMLPLIWTHRGRGVGVLVSRSRDGEAIARVIECLGYVAARGSTTRGGQTGVLEMLTLWEQGRSLTVTPDGPRGPAHVVKPGLVFLASRTGLPVLPVASAAASSWVLRSWDRFRVPRPFARVVVAYGAPVHVPPAIEGEAAEPWRRRIEESLRTLTADLARRAGEPA